MNPQPNTALVSSNAREYASAGDHALVQPASTALPVATGGALAEYDPETFIVPGMENAQPGEFRIPRLQLVQGTSRIEGKDGHQGEWYNSVTGEFIANPELLIIGTAKGRVMFPRAYNAENEPLCGSDNGVAPREEYVGASIKMIGRDAAGDPEVKTGVIPNLCAACPFGVWGDDHVPPPCNEVATFAAMDEDGLPALFQMRSSGMKNVPSLKTLIAANSIRRAIKLGSVTETNDSGTYAIATFTPGKKPGKEWQQTALSLARFGNMAARNQRAAMSSDQADQGRRNFTAGPVGETPEYEDPDDFPF